MRLIKNIKKGANKVLEKICWNMFLNTGDIDIYLYYKAIQEIIQKNIHSQQPIVEQPVF